MTPKRSLASVIVVIAVTVCALVTSAHATSPGKNGKIVFAGPSPNRLWVINPDGTGVRKLTLTKGPQLNDENPDWSPDGSRIAFERCAQICQVWRINADGTELKRLDPCECGMPGWSPNGKQLAVSRFWGGVMNDESRFSEIFVKSAGGGALRQVTHHTASSPFSAQLRHPVWAPDGERLGFEVRNSPLGEPANRRALFIINADGSGQCQLTPWSLNGSDPDWSPHGNAILFRSVPGREQHGNLYTVDADGSGLKQLTRYPAPKALFSGSFSPDGKWITFSRFSGVTPYPGIFVMRANGTGVRLVSSGEYNVAPDWGPAR